MKSPSLLYVPLNTGRVNNYKSRLTYTEVGARNGTEVELVTLGEDILLCQHHALIELGQESTLNQSGCSLLLSVISIWNNIYTGGSLPHLHCQAMLHQCRWSQHIWSSHKSCQQTGNFVRSLLIKRIAQQLCQTQGHNCWISKYNQSFCFRTWKTTIIQEPLHQRAM